MNVLLISPNTLRVPYPVYPLGLDYVADSIGPGHQVRIVDLLAQAMDELAATIADFKPDLIGISIRNIDNTDAVDSRYFLEDHRQLVTWLRQRTSAVLVAGGSGFTIMPQAILELLGVDYGVVGEGERLPLLLDALARGRSPRNIPGIVSGQNQQEGSGAPLPPRPWPDQPFRRVDSQAAHTAFYLKNGGMLNLQTKRGCTFRCIYCPYPHIEGSSHRRIPPAKVAATALELQRVGARYLFFTDSAFNSDIGHSMGVARALKEAGLTIPWGAFFAPTALPDDYFTIMADGGCRHVEFGTESLSDTMLAAYRKPFRKRDVVLAHQQAIAAKLRVAHYFLLGGPGESAATLADCFDSIEQLSQAVYFLFAGIRIYPGTRLYEIARQEGQIGARTDLLQPVFYRPEAIDLTTIESLVKERAGNRINWLCGAGGKAAADTVRTLHDRGMAGPLWEYLVR
ncbi:MAG: lipid biosynthesis B12-binding/radical SAM protein [Desulfopila sp.]